MIKNTFCKLSCKLCCKHDRGLLNYLFWGGSKKQQKHVAGVILREIFEKEIVHEVWVDLSYFMRNSPQGFIHGVNQLMAFQLTTVACSQEMDLSTWQRLNRGIETNGTNVPDHVQQQVYALVNKAACSNARFLKGRFVGRKFLGKNHITPGSFLLKMG